MGTAGKEQEKRDEKFVQITDSGREILFAKVEMRTRKRNPSQRFFLV